MAKGSATAAEMLAAIAHLRRDKLEQYLAADPDRAKTFWEFFDGAYVSKLPLSTACAQWELNYGPMPCSDSHLRNLLSARQKKRG